MIYVFVFSIIYAFFQQKEQLLRAKKSLILFLLLSMIGIVMGIVFIINPYLPSISFIIENYLK